MAQDEQRLRDLLIDAAHDAKPGVGVVAAAARRGRRLRHRRQVLAGTATVVLTGAVAIGALGLVGPQRSEQAQTISPTPQPGQTLAVETRPVGQVQILWQGERDGRSRTVAAWFAADGLLCLGELVPGGYQDVSCGGDPHGKGGPGIDGWPGTAAGVPNVDDGSHTWYLLHVGRSTSRATVTLTTGTVLTAALYLGDGPQAQVLAVAIAPPNSIARQFTAYDANGHQINSARP